MKISKKSGIISLVLVVAIALSSFGFAAWSSELVASGTVGADAEWKVYWSDCVEVDSDNGVVYDDTDYEISTTTTTDDTLYLGDVTFSLPGAWVKYTLTVTNDGTLDAVLDTTKDVKVTGLESVPEILVDLAEVCTTIKAGESCTFDLVLQLDPTYGNAGASEMEIDISATEIELVLDYAPELTVESAPSAVHSV